METVSPKFPIVYKVFPYVSICFHAEKAIKGIGRVGWQAAFLGFYSVLSPQSPVLSPA